MSNDPKLEVVDGGKEAIPESAEETVESFPAEELKANHEKAAEMANQFVQAVIGMGRRYQDPRSHYLTQLAIQKMEESMHRVLDLVMYLQHHTDEGREKIIQAALSKGATIIPGSK